MKQQKVIRFAKPRWAAFVLAWSAVYSAQGGVPLNNLQGAGGVAFNPLAYPAGQNKAEDSDSWVSKPQFGFWYVSLGQVDVDWTTIGAAATILGRLELSYGYELIAPVGENIKKSNLGAKLNLIPENWGGRAYVPAVSVGSLWKTTSEVAEGVDDNAADFYLVATKLVTQGPVPVLLSGGVLNTKEQVTGVFGYNDDSDTTFFGNINIIPLPYLTVGFEYKQGASFSSFKNEDYWQAHVAWFAHPNLTLALAYVHAGDEKSTSRVGLGEGVVVGGQYAF